MLFLPDGPKSCMSCEKLFDGIKVKIFNAQIFEGPARGVGVKGEYLCLKCVQRLIKNLVKYKQFQEEKLKEEQNEGAV